MTVELRTSEAKTIYMLTEIAIGDTFNIPFKYLDFDENISVGIRTQADDDSNDSFNELTLDTDYYIMSSDGTNDIWGVVTFLKAYSGLQSLVIYRNIPVSQEKIFNSQTIFSTTTEAALDKLTMIAQDNVFENRILRAPIDDTVSDSGLELPSGEAGYFYTNESGEIEIRPLEAAQKSLRQPDSETEDQSFVISAEERAGNILAFDENAHVELIPKYTAGDNVQISDQNVVSATDTTYTAGSNVQISDTTISATDTTYTAGTNIQISGNTISATDTTYTAGNNVTITNNQIAATDTTYTPGTNVQISGTTISATDTTYTAGSNVTITNNQIAAIDTTYTAGRNITIDANNAISAPDTVYTAGSNVQISGTTISATDTTYTAGNNITIDANNVISTNYSIYTAGENITIENNVISADVAGAKVADVTNWTAKSTESAVTWDKIVYGDGVFVAKTSTTTKYWDGNPSNSWTAFGTARSGDIAYGNGRFISIENSYAPQSEEEYFYASSWRRGDSSWSSISLVSDACMGSLCYGVYNNQPGFVAVSNTSNTVISSKYTRYSLTFLPDHSNNWICLNPNNLPIAVYSHLVYGDGKFVAISGTTVKMYDGSSWSTGPSLPSAPTSLCYGAEKFIAVCGDIIAIWSGNLNDSWDTSTTAPRTNPTKIRYGNGRFVLLFYGINVIAYSVNGTSWSTQVVSNVYGTDICYGNGKFVVVGSNGNSAYTSTRTLVDILMS